jgi:hypothetical protein
MSDASIASIPCTEILGRNEAENGFEINYQVPKQLVILILFGTKDK